MGEYRLSEEAWADFEGIFLYTIETFGFAQAEKYRVLLTLCIERVAGDPRIGRPIKGRSNMFFQYGCERHVIFYVKEDETIRVVRVLHQSMDFKRHLPR